MTPPARRRYHHGDLRAALVDAAVALIAERGVAGFSLAEASRRLGVAASAPYAHFADRDALLAAVAVRGLEMLGGQLAAETAGVDDPGERLAALARVEVRAAAGHRPLFETLLGPALDRRRYPEVAAAEAPVEAAFRDAAGALTDDAADADALAAALRASAHGFAALLLAGRFGEGAGAVATAAEHAARAARALIAGRALLAGRAGEPVPPRKIAAAPPVQTFVKVWRPPLNSRRVRP